VPEVWVLLHLPSVRTVTLPLPPRTHRADVHAIRIERTHDDGEVWQFDSISVRMLRDPVRQWAERAEMLLSVCPKAKITFGTDFNGLAPQMTFAAPLSYPLHPPISDPLLPLPIDLYPCKKGQTDASWQLDTDGIAHVGMLADLAYALGTHSQSVAEHLYSSVDDVIAMWDKCASFTGTLADSKATT
jgi:hypothetical protein